MGVGRELARTPRYALACLYVSGSPGLCIFAAVEMLEVVVMLFLFQNVTVVGRELAKTNRRLLTSQVGKSITLR